MKKKSIVDPYEPCLCGSGKKYKFCCYLNEDKKFHNAKESHSFIESHKKKLEFCLHSDCNCFGKIIKSHSIQNNKILSKLSVKGHVYGAGYNANNIAGADLIKYGRNDATTSTCFCLYHDTNIFFPIERNDYIGTEEQNFLYAYRAFSKAYYDKLNEQATQQCLFKYCHRKAIEVGLVERMRGTILGVQDNEEIKLIFNTALDNQDYSAIETVSATLDYEIKFATSYMCPVTFDFMGNRINDIWSLKDMMKNIFVNIFPESGKTHIIISWLRKDSDAFSLYKEQFNILKEQKKMFMNTMNNMICCQSDNFALSPELVDNWDEKTKRKFLSEFISFIFGSTGINNIGEEIEKNLIEFPCGFNLFEQ